MHSSILLVGPRVVHLTALFERRKIHVHAAETGVDGVTLLNAHKPHVVIVELNLGDLTATEFLMSARPSHPRTSFLLLDEASKAGAIVKTMQIGVDGFLPAPPDEDRIFFEVDRQLHRLRPQPDNGTILEQRGEDERVVELQLQVDMMAQELAANREQREKIDAVLTPLVGELDAATALRLKERLGYADVVEAEVNTLKRGMSQLTDQRDRLQSELKTARANAADYDKAAIAAALDDLQGQVMRLNAELGEARSDHASSLLALEEQHEQSLQETRTRLHAEAAVQMVRESQRLDEAERLLAEVAQARDAYAGRVAGLEQQVRGAEGVLERERLSAQERQRTLEAQHAIEREQLSRALEQAVSAVAQAKTELGGAQSTLSDRVLELEELSVKVEYLEGAIAEARRDADAAHEQAMEQAQAQVAELEAAHKRERLRLVEEKQLSMGDGQEAKQREAELAAQLAVAHEEAHARQATLLSTQQRLTASEAEAAGLRGRVDALEQQLTLALDKHRALETLQQSSQRAHEEKDQEHQRRLLEQGTELQRLRSLHDDSQQRASQMAATLSDAADRLSALELERSELQNALAEAEHERQSLRQELQQKDSAVGERLAEREQAWQQAFAELQEQLSILSVERGRAVEERDDLRAELRAVHDDQVESDRELDATKKMLFDAKAQLERGGGLVSNQGDELSRLSSELLLVRESLSLAVGERDAVKQQLAEAQARTVGQPMSSTAATTALLDTVRNLVDAIEPLRWGLGGAIEYFSGIDVKDANVGTHVRNLKLLQATLVRLGNEAPR
jgi:chromosome segregation ATPase